MFYLKNSAEEELLEIITVERDYGKTLPYFAQLNSELRKNTQLHLPPALRIFEQGADGEFLLWQPETAMWCYLDSNEMQICQELKQVTTFSTLREKFPQYAHEPLTAFLTHLYRRGLLETDHESGIDPHIYEQGPLFTKRYLVELLMTEKCNLRCRYCFAEAAPENYTMPLDIGYLAIDKAFALPASSFIIEFAGGETFIEFETFKKLIAYIALKKKQTGKEPEVVVQSNGTMFHKRHLRKLILKHGITTGVSIDGPPEVQNAVRPMVSGKASSDTVWRGIDALKKHGFMVATLTTVSRANVERPEDIVNYFVSRGIHHGLFKEVLGLGRAEDSWDDFAVKPEEFFAFMKRFLNYTGDNHIPFKDLTTKRLLTNLLVRTRDFRCMRSPCNAGFDYFVIRPNGDVYPCAEYVRSNLRMGNIKDPEPLQMYFKKHPTVIEMKLHRIVKNIAACCHCDWRHLCEGGCSLAALKTYGTLYHAAPMCQFYRMIYPFLLKFVYRYPEVVCDYLEDAEIVRSQLIERNGGDSESEPANGN